MVIFFEIATTIETLKNLHYGEGLSQIFFYANFLQAKYWETLTKIRSAVHSVFR